LIRVVALLLLAVALAIAAASLRAGVDPMGGSGFVLAGLVAALAVAFGVRAPAGFVLTLRIVSIGAFVVVAIRVFLSVAGTAISNASDPFAWLGIMLGAAFAAVPLGVGGLLIALTQAASTAPRGRPPLAVSRRRWLVAAVLSGAAVAALVGVGQLQRASARRASVDKQLAAWSAEPPAHATDDHWARSEGSVVGAAFARDGRLLATVGSGPVGRITVKLWDLSRAAGDEEVASAGIERGMAASLESVMFANGEGEATPSLLLRFIDGSGMRVSVPGLAPLADPPPVPAFPGQMAAQRRWTSVNGQVLDWAKDGKLTLSAADGQVLAGGMLHPTYGGWQVPGIAFSGDGAQVAAAHAGQLLRLSSAGQAQVVRGPASAQVVAWSEDDSQLFVGGGGSGWIVDPAGSAPERKLRSRKLDELAAFRASLGR